MGEAPLIVPAASADTRPWFTLLGTQPRLPALSHWCPKEGKPGGCWAWSGDTDSITQAGAVLVCEYLHVPLQFPETDKTISCKQLVPQNLPKSFTLMFPPEVRGTGLWLSRSLKDPQLLQMSRGRSTLDRWGISACPLGPLLLSQRVCVA